MAKVQIDWPKDFKVQGMLSFPLTSDEDLEAVVEWRLKRQLKKPKYVDKISANLLINEKNLERAIDYLETTYLPFADKLWKDTDGDKGVEPAVLKQLVAQVKKRDWSEKNFPIRNLTEADKEHGPEDAVAKLRFGGPFEAPFVKKALIRDAEGDPRVVSLDDLNDDGVLPEGRNDPSKLWWDAGWYFKTGLRFNVFDTASSGISAYGRVLYLLPHLGLPSSGSGDADIIEDGEDFE